MDFDQLLKQAQALQSNLTSVQTELEETEYTGNSGGSEGVTIRMNGKNEVLEVQIAEELMGIDNREMLQDMILIAFNNANDKAAADREDKLGSAAGGFNIPGM